VEKGKCTKVALVEPLCRHFNCYEEDEANRKEIKLVGLAICKAFLW